MKIAKDNLELLLRARDYLELVCDELETNDETEYENYQQDPVIHLYAAMDALNATIERVK